MNDRKNSTILYGHIMLYIIRFVNIVLLFSGNKNFFPFLVILPNYFFFSPMYSIVFLFTCAKSRYYSLLSTMNE